MSPILTIAKKELQSYFNSPLAYIFLNVFLILMAWLFFQSYFLVGQAEMRGFFGLIPWVFLFLMPAISMRTFSEEKKLGTIELLLTSPLRERDIVLGKFLSCFLFLAITLLLSFMIPVMVFWSGDADLGVILASYLGALFLGSAYLTVGMYISSYTNNQIIAFLLGLAVCFLFLIIGELFVLGSLPYFLAPIFKFFGLGVHFSSIARGVLDSRDILFYLSFIFFFLLLTMRRLQFR